MLWHTPLSGRQHIPSIPSNMELVLWHFDNGVADPMCNAQKVSIIDDDDG